MKPVTKEDSLSEEDTNCLVTGNTYLKQDIISAKEWLKKELCKKIPPYNRNGMLKIIDEAFDIE